MTIRTDPEGNETATLFDLVDLDGAVVLEIGCGDGRLTWRYADRAAHVTAIEPFEDSIARAKERLRERDAIRGRGYPSRTSTNREAKSSTGLAREWKRRGRIRHLRAKPAGIWAKASKKKRGDREVESTINAWGLLLSGQKATDRNRRVSSPLSPIYYLFLSPSGKLYQKVQHLLAEEERAEGSPPPVVIK